MHDINTTIEEIGLYEDILGWLHPDEANALFTACMDSPIKNFIEFGTFNGKSLCVLATAAKKLGGIAIGCDYFDVIEYGNQKIDKHIETMCNLECYGLSDYAVLVKGDHSQTLPSLTMQAGVCFVDGDHYCEAILQNFKHAYRMTVCGGFIAFHDYDHPQYPDVKMVVDLLAEKYELQDEGLYHTLKLFSKT